MMAPLLYVIVLPETHVELAVWGATFFYRVGFSRGWDETMTKKVGGGEGVKSLGGGGGDGRRRVV
jgi:hypothetical protein